MEMQVPPGIRYLIARIPRLCAPGFLAYMTNKYLLRTVLGIYLPEWFSFLVYVLAFPVVVTVIVFWTDLRTSAKAMRLGAILPPLLPSKYPGSIESLFAMSNASHIMYPGDLIQKNFRKYGNTFNYRLLFKNRYITDEPEYVKIMLATEFESYEKGETFRSNYRPLLGSGVFNSDGEMWKFHRGMTRPFFSKDRISHFDIFDRHCDNAIKKIKARLQEGFPIDIQDVVSRFTLDSATEFLFGNDVRSLSAGLAYPPGASVSLSADAAAHPANVFANAFLKAQAISSSRSRWNEDWPLVSFWKDDLIKEMEAVFGFIDPIVHKALEAKKMRNDKTSEVDEDATLLEQLVQLTDDAKIIRDETLNILIAGRDTTASTLTFMVYMLSQHPQVLQRLRQEVLDKLGPSNRPVHDDLKEMKYLRATINETLRLFPAVPFNVRFSRKDTLWPSMTGGKPFFVPADTRCVYSVFLMHRRTDLWGPDALEFDPDRFLDERVSKYLIPNPFIFLPFNAGPRICLGQQFAYNEISFMMIRLLQAFSEITWASDACLEAKPPSEWATDPEGSERKKIEKAFLKAHLTMYAYKGFWVNMKEANNTDAA